MFEFSRELRRLLATDGPRDGITGGQAPLLELLDLNLLRNEARAADISAGRISAKDPDQRSLDAARVWRELARRTGDSVALRKAAAAAERSARGFHRDGRTRRWALARCEQALTAIVGADLFGDEGLVAAARFALKEVLRQAPSSAAAALALAQMARLDGRAVLTQGSPDEVLAAARACEAPMAALEAQTRNGAINKSALVELYCGRCELLLAAGARLRDADLLERALGEISRLLGRVDATYEPVSRTRVQELHGAALVALGEVRGEIDKIADGVSDMSEALDLAGVHHSPVDWARLHHSLAVALRTLGEVSESERAFDQSLACFDRALAVLKDQPGLILRTAVAGDRSVCLARRAELTGDLAALDEAALALKAELVALSPGRDPVLWAVCQVNLVRIYEVRMARRGVRDGEVAAAATALTAALEVFGEHGHRTLADDAARTLERLVGADRSPV